MISIQLCNTAIAEQWGQVWRRGDVIYVKEGTYKLQGYLWGFSSNHCCRLNDISKMPNICILQIQWFAIKTHWSTAAISHQHKVTLVYTEIPNTYQKVIINWAVISKFKLKSPVVTRAGKSHRRAWVTQRFNASSVLNMYNCKWLKISFKCSTLDIFIYSIDF